MQHLTEGSILFPLQPLEFRLLAPDSCTVINGKGILHLDPKTEPPINLLVESDTLLLLGVSITDGTMELRCIVNGKTRRIYLRESDFNKTFCVYPSSSFKDAIGFSPEEDWLSRYFSVHGRVFCAKWNKRPSIIFGDYEKLRQDKFLHQSLGAENQWKAFLSSQETVSLDKKDFMVIGRAIRIRPGNRKLIFEFYHLDSKQVAWWEFNERLSPKKSFMAFRDYWSSYSMPSGNEYKRLLYMKR